MMPTAIVLGLGFVVLMLAWIVLAVCTQRPPAEPLEPKNTAVPSPEWLRGAYGTVTSLYIEVDREIWQVSTIFTSASLLILGWVVTTSSPLRLPIIVLAGCASLLLVTIATVFKHRLRNFNLVHIQHLRLLEKAGVDPGDPGHWGLHHRRRFLKAGGLGWLTSIHGVMDLYALAFASLWVLLWLYRARHP